MDHRRLERPFWWGLLLITDRDSVEVPELTDAAVSVLSDAIAVKVLHAQDVDLSGLDAEAVVSLAEVRVDIHVGEAAPNEVLFTGTIDVPSGVLTVGDADQEETLDIGSGRWAVQLDCDPPEHAEQVRVWLQRGSA